jgi:hypothetical protein
MYIHIYMHMHICIYVYTYIHIYMYVCMYTCVCVCVIRDIGSGPYFILARDDVGSFSAWRACRSLRL